MYFKLNESKYEMHGCSKCSSVEFFTFTKSTKKSLNVTSVLQPPWWGTLRCVTQPFLGWPTSLSESNKDRKINWPETRAWCLNNLLPQNPSKSDFNWIISTAFFIKGAWRRLGALQYTGNEAAAGAEERVYLAGLIDSSTVVSSSSSRVQAAH